MTSASTRVVETAAGIGYRRRGRGAVGKREEGDGGQRQRHFEDEPEHALFLARDACKHRGRSQNRSEGRARAGLENKVSCDDPYRAMGSSYLMPAKPARDVAALPLLSVGAAVVMGAVAFNAIAEAKARDAVVVARLSRVAMAAVLV